MGRKAVQKACIRCFQPRYLIGYVLLLAAALRKKGILRVELLQKTPGAQGLFVLGMLYSIGGKSLVFGTLHDFCRFCKAECITCNPGGFVGKGYNQQLLAGGQDIAHAIIFGGKAEPKLPVRIGSGAVYGISLKIIKPIEVHFPIGMIGEPARDALTTALQQGEKQDRGAKKGRTNISYAGK